MQSSIDGELEDTLTPLEDRILVILDEESEETDSGIYLPEGVSGERGGGATGTVVAIGDDAPDINGQEELALGDQILFNENIGRDIPGYADENEYLLIRKANLLAVLGE